MYSQRNKEVFLQLVRLGIGHHSEALPLAIDWDEIEVFASNQGLAAIFIDGVELLPENIRPPKEVLLSWIGEVLQRFEYRYEAYKKSIAEMAGFFNSHNQKMMVLKGYACSLDWPKPNHRPCGDIDIWMFGQQKDADELLAEEKGIKIDRSHHHHTVFQWRGFSVENHYDFINIYHHKSHRLLEKLFKELGVDDTHYVELNEEKVYMPSPNLHALFLLKHTMLHFVSGETNLRQLLDWAFFVKKHTNEVDWNWLETVLDEYGMMPLYQQLNAICVDDLGFDSQLFPSIQFNPRLKNKVLNEFLEPNQEHNGNKGLILRVVSSYRRWKDSAWKHELCYKESMWSAFWYGIWGHLLKPKSI